MDLSGHEGEIPIPITTTHVGGHGHSHVHTIIHGNPPISTVSSEDHHHHHHNHHYSKKGVVVKYRECLKNHAASLGGNATDGCGEFMPSGDEGTLEALRCSACSCHRNFHRREFEGEASPYGCLHHLKGRGVVSHKGFLISGQPPPPHHMIMPLGALQASESDEMEGGRVVVAGPPMVKKRFRTKFTLEQKEKMMGFAERVGWKLQKLEEGVVQQFCQEIGVRRRVLKVWMHNNKHSLAKKGSLKVE